MPELYRRLILANGERYQEPIVRRSQGGPTEPPRSYDEARDLVKREVTTALAKFGALPQRKRFSDETVLCLRLHPDMTAKSYDPEGIFSIKDLENVGSRNYRSSIQEVAQTNRIKKQVEQHLSAVTGRMIFVRSNEAGFRRLLSFLERAEAILPNAFREEIQRIERFDLLGPSEQVQGFVSGWEEGRVELVLHPSRHSEEEQTNFLKELFRGQGSTWKRPNVAHYDKGPLFISCYLNADAIRALAGANPLRTVHPLIFAELENLRGLPTFPAPPAPTSTTRSTIKVGMFDGGIVPGHPLLNGHAEQDEGLSIKTTAKPDGIAHGIAVAGALLYGPLNDREIKIPLSAPAVSVVSIRVLPTSNPSDMDLYESIDVIEKAVPERPDIKVFNVSVGPRGPVLNDTISRFTFALDRLAKAHKVTFCAAAGNDGAAVSGMNRIQSPADLVNGLGVGAYTKRNGSKVHAPYSCQGPGRECAKLKPDVVAFGGCDQSPIHLVAAIPGAKVLNAGTSFAAPIVAALCAQAAERFDRGTALLSRALVIHNAKHPANGHDDFLGHGIAPETIEDLLRCDDGTVTVIFQGGISAGKSVKLPIMLPPNAVNTGKIMLKWTVAALPLVDPNHPSDYTVMCVEDTFYPDDRMYTYTPKRGSLDTKSKRLSIVNDAAQIKRLLADGYKKSALPVSDSANQYATESELRADFKWEAVVRRYAPKYAANLHKPFIVLHAIARHGAVGPIEYAAIVTISAPKFQGDLYDKVIRRFPALQPIRLRTEAELRIQING